MNRPPLSRRSQSLPASPIRRLAPLARRAVAEGTDVIRLNIGEPDLAPPPSFAEGLRMHAGPLVPYAPSDGDPTLLRALCDDYERRLSVSLDPSQVRVTVGGSEALTICMHALCEPGDNVLVVEPFYTNYGFFAASAGVELRVVQTPGRARGAPTFDDVVRSADARTRAIIVNSPGNPSGDVLSRAELAAIHAACVERDLWLVSDEVYRELVYDGTAPTTAMALDDPDARVVLVDSLSKRFNLCGARLGVLATRNADLAEVALRFCQARLSAATIDQRAAAHMLGALDAGYIDAARAVYERRRDVLVAAFSAIAGVRCTKPQGAFYALLDLPVDDADAFARFMLTDVRHDGRTAHLTPAADFYRGAGKGTAQVRVAFVVEEERIRQAAACTAAGLAMYPRRM